MYQRGRNNAIKEAVCVVIKLNILFISPSLPKKYGLEICMSVSHIMLPNGLCLVFLEDFKLGEKY